LDTHVKLTYAENNHIKHMPKTKKQN